MKKIRKDVKKRILLELNEIDSEQRGFHKVGTHLALLRSIPKTWTMEQWAEAMDELEREGLIKYTGYGRHKKVSGRITKKGRDYLRTN